MYWQREFLRSAEPWTNGGTLKLDLPKNGYLGSIQIHAKRAGITDALNAVLRWRLLDYISKVEVIANGSTPLKSVTGEVAKALTFFDGGGPVPDQEFNYGGSTKRAHFMINFGRKLFDKSFGLDLSKFSSVELQLTNDGSSTYFAGDWAVDVLCYYLRGGDAPAPEGFFRTEEWRKWTTVQAEKKYLELPTDMALRRIVLQVLAAAGTNANADTQSYNVLDLIELYLKTGTLKVMDHSLRELWYENLFHYGRQPMVGLEPYHTSLYGIKTGLGQTLAKAAVALPQGMLSATPTIALEPGGDNMTQKILRTGTDNASMIMIGLGLENCAVIPFDQDDDPEAYLDTSAEATVQLNCRTADSSSADNGTIRVVTDRLVRY